MVQRTLRMQSSAPCSCNATSSTKRGLSSRFESINKIINRIYNIRLTKDITSIRTHRVSPSALRASSLRIINAASADIRPTAAETARTIVDLVAHGTICTIGDDGIPLGTYASYVLDQFGQPIVRLRADAVHTANLGRESRCSLFVQPGEYPARLLARVTLIGTVEPVQEDVAAQAAELHNTLHAGGVGVDAPRPDDLYFRLNVDHCFFVGQLSGESAAEVISGDEYRAAVADPLRTCAASLAAHMNTNRLEDIMRISCRQLNVAFEDMYYAELLWIDRLGCYLKAVGQDGSSTTLRVPFPRDIDEERDARSALTMMSQVAWEAERPYVPQAQPLPAAAEK